MKFYCWWCYGSLRSANMIIFRTEEGEEWAMSTISGLEENSAVCLRRVGTFRVENISFRLTFSIIQAIDLHPALWRWGWVSGLACQALPSSYIPAGIRLEPAILPLGILLNQWLQLLLNLWEPLPWGSHIRHPAYRIFTVHNSSKITVSNNNQFQN